jgi:prophage maintenance system killer protein
MATSARDLWWESCFLELNGYRFSASEEDAAQMVLEWASGNLDEAGYIAFFALRQRSKKMKQHFRPKDIAGTNLLSLNF